MVATSARTAISDIAAVISDCEWKAVISREEAEKDHHEEIAPGPHLHQLQAQEQDEQRHVPGSRPSRVR
jgi:hypothetical protein